MLKSLESGWSLTLQAFWASVKKVPIKPEVSVADLIHHLNKWGPVLPPSTLYKVQTCKK